MMSSRSLFFLTENTVDVLLSLKRLPYSAVGVRQVARDTGLSSTSVQGVLNRLVQASWAERVQWTGDVDQGSLPSPRPKALYRLDGDSVDRQIGHVRHPDVMERVSVEFPDHPVSRSYTEQAFSLPSGRAHARALGVFLERHPVPVWAGDLSAVLGLHQSEASQLLRRLEYHGRIVHLKGLPSQGAKVSAARRYHRLTRAGMAEAGPLVLGRPLAPFVPRPPSLRLIDPLQARLLIGLMDADEPEPPLWWVRELGATPVAVTEALYGLRMMELATVRVDPRGGPALPVLTEQGRTFTRERVESAPLSSFGRT